MCHGMSSAMLLPLCDALWADLLLRDSHEHIDDTGVRLLDGLGLALVLESER